MIHRTFCILKSKSRCVFLVCLTSGSICPSHDEFKDGRDCIQEKYAIIFCTKDEYGLDRHYTYPVCLGDDEGDDGGDVVSCPHRGRGTIWDLCLMRSLAKPLLWFELGLPVFSLAVLSLAVRYRDIDTLSKIMSRHRQIMVSASLLQRLIDTPLPSFPIGHLGR